MRLALVYDRVNKIGGAERVLQTLLEIWPNTPLYTSVYEPKSAPWAASTTVHTSFLQHLPFARSRHELFAWAMPTAFESFDFSPFDVVISVTSAEAKGIITPAHTLHISYLLTPTRYLWSHTHEYLAQTPLLLRPFSRAIFSQLRVWDQMAAGRPDRLIAISQTVKSRALKYYRRPVDALIYPPTTLPPSTSDHPKKDFYLVVSRLVPYKKIDLVVRAFNQLKKPLIVVGTGSEYEKIRKIAGPNVTMVGKLTDSELVSYYQAAKALVFPSEEDFGLVAIEAQSQGTPVIAFAKGGARETVIAGKTGVFFDSHTPKSLIIAINQFEAGKFSQKHARTQAAKFSTNRFKQTFSKYVEDQWQSHQKLQ